MLGNGSCVVALQVKREPKPFQRIARLGLLECPLECVMSPRRVAGLQRSPAFLDHQVMMTRCYGAWRSTSNGWSSITG
jgi:hypothetical protein